MTKKDLLSRRKFLKRTGMVLGGSAVACAGLAYFGMQTPSSVLFPERVCQAEGEKRTLICYESKCGATAEVAAQIHQELCVAGLSADLVRAANFESLEGYDSAIFGTPVYMGKLINGILKAAERFASIAPSPTSAVFALGLTMREDTTETREEMMAYLQPLSDILAPVSVGLYGGRISLDTLPPLYRTFSKADEDGILTEGDFRNWDQISQWAGSLAAKLV